MDTARPLHTHNTTLLYTGGARQKERSSYSPRNMRALVQLALLVVGGLVLGGLLVMGVKQHDFKRCDQSGFCARQRAFARWVDAYHGGEVERERGAGADAASAVEVAAAAASEDATAAEDATASGDATAASDDATPSTPAWTGPPPQPPVLYLDRDSLRWDTERGTVTGQLHVESAHGDTSSPPAPLAFSLRALHGGETLHVVVDEPVPSSTTGTAYANSDRAHRARARVDNVLVDGVLDDTHVSPFHSAHLTDDDGNTLVLSFGDGYRATVRLRPFALDVWRGNVAVAALNGKGYLNVERMRGKRSVANAATAATAAAGDTSDANYDPVLGGPEDGPMRYDSTLGRDRWAESFNGHRDDKPFGRKLVRIACAMVLEYLANTWKQGPCRSGSIFPFLVRLTSTVSQSTRRRYLSKTRGKRGTVDE